MNFLRHYVDCGCLWCLLCAGRASLLAVIRTLAGTRAAMCRARELWIEQMRERAAELERAAYVTAFPCLCSG